MTVVMIHKMKLAKVNERKRSSPKRSRIRKPSNIRRKLRTQKKRKRRREQTERRRSRRRKKRC